MATQANHRPLAILEDWQDGSMPSSNPSAAVKDRNKEETQDRTRTTKPSTAPPPRPAQHVADIRHVLQYQDSTGRVIKTRTSEIPFRNIQNTDTINNDGGGAQARKQKPPVFEIVTTVETASRNDNTTELVQHRRPQTLVLDSSDDSESCVSYDDDIVSTYDGRPGRRQKGTKKMIIHSPHLIAALNATIGTYPDIDLLHTTVSLPAPYAALIHNRAALFSYRTAQPPSHDPQYAATTAAHIDILLGYLDSIYGARIREEEARHCQQYPHTPNNKPVTTFNWIWLLYKPGEVVYKQVTDIWTAFVIERVLMGQVSNKNTAAPYICVPGGPEADVPQGITCTVEAWAVQYSQGRMRRRTERFYIRSFSGERTVDSLQIVPAAYFAEDLEAQGGQTMAELQIRMGRLYWELVQQPTYQHYDGLSLDMHSTKKGH
ncbi:hypothetical protein BD289DRAFT_455666, partial [Coniella lustricola]